MSKNVKRKKFKKPKPREVCILSANEIENYIRLKYDVDDNGFWKWFFSECSWGDINLLGLHEEDIEDIIQPNHREYVSIIKEDFIDDADEESNLEIENDL